jgi:hypothetical protein
MNVSKVQVRYNEHNAQLINFLNPSSGSWEEAFNMNQHIMRRPLAFYEWDLFRKNHASLDDAIRMQNAHELVRDRQTSAVIISKAKAEKKEQSVLAKSSKSRREIRKNKADEQNAFRSDATHQLLPISTPDLTKPKEIENKPNLVKNIAAGITAGLWENPV